MATFVKKGVTDQILNGIPKLIKPIKGSKWVSALKVLHRFHTKDLNEIDYTLGC
jgi:hypothetical protein